MHLSSLYIDGYGPFEDSLISDFTEGLNLVMAENEPAAAALREFIWSVIFGFETDDDGIDMLETSSRQAAGGFLGFESPDGPVTVARYRRVGAGSPDGAGKDASSDEKGLVNITGPVGSLDQIVGRIEPRLFRRLVQIDAREITAFRAVIRRQIAETFAERAREAAEAEAVLREAGGQINVPTIEEIMDEMRIARDYQVARADNLARSVKGVGRRLRASRSREARLKIIDQVRPDWNTMLELQRQMDELPRLPYLSDDPIGRLDELTEGKAEAQAKLEAARAAEAAKSSELDTLRPSEEEAAWHREIHELKPAREGLARQRTDTAKAEEDFRDVKADLKSELSEIGGDWTAERVREFAASVDMADVGRHESAIQQAADELGSAEQASTSAHDSNVEIATELNEMQSALKLLGEIPAHEEKDLAEGLGTLRSLRATLLAIAGKKRVIADLQVKRADARRLGSGVSRLVMQAQSIVSVAFLLVGFLIWGVAKVASDGAVQRTGLVMMGAGITGVIFAAMFMWLQHHPMFGRSVINKNGSPKQALEPADGADQDAALVKATSSLTLIRRPARILVFTVRWTVVHAYGLVARARGSRSTKAKKAKQSAVIIVKGEPAIAAVRRSPFGIKEFLGKFIQIEKQVDGDAVVVAEPADEDDLLSSIADQILAEDEVAMVDEEKASAAVDEAEASIPEELRKAQERSNGETGRIGGLLARVLKSSNDSKDQSDDEILSEMSEDGIWSASGKKRRPLPARLVSSLLGSLSRGRTASRPTSGSDEDDDETSGASDASETSDAIAATVDEEPSEKTAEAEVNEEPVAEDQAEGVETDQPEDETPESEPASENPDESAEESWDVVDEEFDEELADVESTDEPTAEVSDEPDVTPDAAPDEPAVDDNDEPEVTPDAATEEPIDGEAEAVEAETAVSEDEPEPDILAAEAAEESPAPEVVAEEVTYEFGDPIEALDEVLDTITRELEALTAEFEKLSEQYARLAGPPVEGGLQLMTVEMIEHAALACEGQISTLREAAKIRSNIASLEEKREGTQATVAQAEEQLVEVTAETEIVKDQWVKWLSTAGLSTDLDPSGVREISEALDPVRVRISAVEILREKLEGLQAQAGELEARVRKAAGISEHDDLAAAFDMIDAEAATAAVLAQKLTGLEDMLNSLAMRTSEAESGMSRSDSLLRATLDEVGAEDESHFRELIGGAAKRRQLVDDLDRKRIETPLLTGVDSADLEEELRTIPQEQVEAELAELPGHIERLHSQLATLEQDLTRTGTELAGMPEMPDKDEGDKASDADARSAMPALLRRPMRRSAMQAATKNLERFSAGKYRGISAVASEDNGAVIGYKVVDANGVVDDPEESESAVVFMALRVALIEDYFDHTASLPAAILDVTVPDDPEASQAVITGVMALSETIQVVCISSDPAASGRFAAVAEGRQINMVDAISLDSPFRKVSGEN